MWRQHNDQRQGRGVGEQENASEKARRCDQQAIGQSNGGSHRGEECKMIRRGSDRRGEFGADGPVEEDDGEHDEARIEGRESCAAQRQQK